MFQITGNSIDRNDDVIICIYLINTYYEEVLGYKWWLCNQIYTKKNFFWENLKNKLRVILGLINVLSTCL